MLHETMTFRASDSERRYAVPAVPESFYTSAKRVSAFVSHDAESFRVLILMCTPHEINLVGEPTFFQLTFASFLCSHCRLYLLYEFFLFSCPTDTP
jgi:hypothetical protein